LSNSNFGEVRIILNQDNEPLFCLSDICQTLDLNPSKAAQQLTDDVLSKYPISYYFGTKRMGLQNQ